MYRLGRGKAYERFKAERQKEIDEKVKRRIERRKILAKGQPLIMVPDPDPTETDPVEAMFKEDEYIQRQQRMYDKINKEYRDIIGQK